MFCIAHLGTLKNWKMINSIVVISLICTGIHALFLEGNLLSPVRVRIANKLDVLCGKRWSKIIQKPLYDCLACMASVWGLIFAGFNIPVILAVCGFNFIIARMIEAPDEPEMLTVHGTTEYADDIPTISRNQQIQHVQV
jgi:hypothetical protein